MEYVAAVQTIGERMQSDPLVFGEPLYRLPTLHLVVCIQVILPVAIEYGVNELTRHVFVRHVRLV